MHSAQRQVAEMYKVSGDPVPCPCTPRLPGRRTELRAALIREEAQETIDSMAAGRLVETIDGLCDLLYVIYGTAIEMGVDLEPYFNEVHASNLAKFAGSPGRRDDGKWLKPEGWQPPDIYGILMGRGGRYT